MAITLDIGSVTVGMSTPEKSRVIAIGAFE